MKQRPEDAKHPLILSKDQHVSMLIPKHVHQNLGHGGQSHTQSKLRKTFWITKSNLAIRNAAFVDATIDLPKERILPDLPPFTNTGVDYFGPVEVRKGRSICK